MQYRTIGKAGLSVSEIGLGCEYLEGKDYQVVETVIREAMEAGINVLDVFMSEPQVRSHIGRALSGRREEVLIEGHIRSVWKDGQYGTSFQMKEIREAFEDLLRRLNTDYVDMGMIHIVDSPEDYERMVHGEIMEYAQQLKKQGKVRAIGLSTHNAQVALQAAQENLIDVMLFSTNMAYDLIPDTLAVPWTVNPQSLESGKIQGMNPVREQLYQICAANGIGIQVMKGLGAGALLDEKRSPFGRAMTVSQCIHYLLNRPGVTSAMLGMQTAEEVRQAVAYETCTDEEKDYTPILDVRPEFSLEGRCMYCNHCLPCPAYINIAAVNKYLDLAMAQSEVPPTVREHYQQLEKPASACIQCGACEGRCPFGVPVRDKMRQAVQVFGR